MTDKLTVDCCVAGGGPAGLMAGLLFARAGCRTLVLEKHADFLRDFRGDTVHPSTLEILRELGLLEDFLKRPHQRLSKLSGTFAGQQLNLVDFSHIDASCKFIAFMPQWHFLDFLAQKAKTLPGFKLCMRAEVKDLIEEEGRIAGLVAQTPDGRLEIRSKLVIGADGRGSDVRERSGLHVRDIGAPIDVLWFKVPRDDINDNEPMLNNGRGHVLITINRGDYYQCAVVVRKGGADEVKAKGLEAFRASVIATAPQLAPHIDTVTGFDDVKLLTVKVDRLENWSRPGLVMIGDAAHAMSPVGGVGINLAVQDAVAAANLLAGPLADGTLKDSDLDTVRQRRMWPTRATQFAQVQAQNHIITPMIAAKGPPGPPLPLRIVAAVPWLRRRLAKLVGIGVRPEHVLSPERHAIGV